MIEKMTNAASAAAVMLCLMAPGVAQAGGKQLVVLKGLCPQMITQMRAWSVGRTEYTAYAVPTAKEARACGEPGPAVTAGIATSPDLRKARKEARRVCNDNRGDFGRCIVVGYLRNKR